MQPLCHLSRWKNCIELGLNSAQTGQLNPLFNTYTDVVNRVGARQNCDWLMSHII